MQLKSNFCAVEQSNNATAF